MRTERQLLTRATPGGDVRLKRAAPWMLAAGGSVLLALHAVPSFATAPASDSQRALRDLGLAPAASGGMSGGRMTASALAQPIAAAPERAAIDLYLRFASGDRLGALLSRMGATGGDAAAVQAILAGQPIEPGARIQLKLGRKDPSGRRPIELVALRAGLDRDIRIAPSAGGGLAASITRLAVDSTPRRVRGRVGDGLYWTLRSAGIAPDAAGDYLKALATQLDVGADLTPDDRFDLILANQRVGGENRPGGLLYAGIERSGAKPIRLMKWARAGKPGWYTADSLTPIGGSMLWPVSARITSGFGLRVHPVLHYARMHRGLDFGAPWGSPIFASADGVVSRAGWAGGYGQQVRIDHGEGFGSSYSHMSRMTVSPGSAVRQGQLIGYVGSTGLSTGPHLHYETYIHGQAVDPRSVNFARAAAPDPTEVNAFKAQLARLLKVGVKGA